MVKKKKVDMFEEYINNINKRKKQYKKRIIRMLDEDMFAFSQALEEIMESVGFKFNK